MEINIKATPEEVAKLLQAIGGSEEQLKIKLPVAIKDDKITFREVDLVKNSGVNSLERNDQKCQKKN